MNRADATAIVREIVGKLELVGRHVAGAYPEWRIDYQRRRTDQFKKRIINPTRLDFTREDGTSTTGHASLTLGGVLVWAIDLGAGPAPILPFGPFPIVIKSSVEPKALVYHAVGDIGTSFRIRIYHGSTEFLNTVVLGDYTQPVLFAI